MSEFPRTVTRRRYTGAKQNDFVQVEPIVDGTKQFYGHLSSFSNFSASIWQSAQVFYFFYGKVFS